MAESSATMSEIPPAPIPESGPRVDTRPTPHLPPPSEASSPSAPYDERAQRTIKINVEIVVPQLLLSVFGSTSSQSKWSRRRPKSFWRRAMIGLIGTLYLSFMIGQAVCWGLREHYDLHNAVPPLIVATFIPYFDLLANIWVVRVMKSDREQATKNPSFHHAFVLMINIILLILELIILGFASAWAKDSLDYYWYYLSDKRAAIAGLTLYSMCTMITMKIILAILVFYAPETFSRFQQTTSHSHRRSGGYEELGQEYYDEDARIRPGMVVSHNHEDETPRNSTEQGKILLL